MDIYDQVARNIDRLAENDVNWSRPATAEQLQRAREGKLELLFCKDDAIPAEWLGDLHGKKVLCLRGQAASKHRCWPAPGRK